MGRDNYLANERRANTTSNALEESRTLLEQADRSRRIIEQELSDTNEQLSNLTCTNQAIAGAKRKLESEMQTLSNEVSEMMNECRATEDRYKNAMVDAARMAVDLRCEQDSGSSFEKMKKVLECQVKEMQSKLDDSESNTLKTGKKAMHKMDSRIRELYSEFAACQRRLADAQANLHK